jgi:UDP-3-O-[3-hydroxymyristoyl] glucosamine N-acyltransferase
MAEGRWGAGLAAGRSRRASQVFEHLNQSQGGACLIDVAIDPDLVGAGDLETAEANQLSYLEGAGAYARFLQTTQATALILPLKQPALHEQARDRGLAWIAVPYPRLAFAQAIALFYQPFRPQAQIHPTAVIDPSVTLGQGVSIGAHVVIQPDCVVGDRVCIHPNVVIYPGVHLGEGTVLHSNCTIQERSQIGNHCVIHSGSVIGSEGFGFVPIPEGWFKMEQSGRVVLEDGVEVGCNSTIDRPAVGETRLGMNAKLDNMVHVGHGCTIGKNGAIAAQTGMAGGVVVGDRVIIAGQVGLSNRATIGDGVTITSKAGVHANIKPGAVVSGYPAIPHKVWLRAALLYGRLPEIYKVFRQIRSEEHRAQQPSPDENIY